ncbi:unnamed protein product, partial [marine sediment metagenome]
PVPGESYLELQVVGSVIYYAFLSTGSYPAKAQVWTAVSNLDGTGFARTEQTTSAYTKVNPQLHVVSSTIYYIWREYDDTHYQIWTATSNLDGTKFTVTKQTTSAYNKYDPELQVVGDTVYYAWWEASNHIWAAESNLDGTEFAATQLTTTPYLRTGFNFQRANSINYYVWAERDILNDSQIWTGRLVPTATVTTDPATEIGPIAATLNGTLVDEGLEPCDCGFEWGPDTGYGVITPTESKTTGETFSQAIHGLFPNTTFALYSQMTSQT